MTLTIFYRKFTALLIALLLVVPSFYTAVQSQKAMAGWPVTCVNCETETTSWVHMWDQFIDTVENTITAVETTYLALKESILDPISKLLANQLVSLLVNQMFGFISKGNSGAPSYVTNPQAYFGGVAEESTQVYLTDLQNNRPNMLPSIRNAVRQRIIEENYVDSKRMEQSTFPGGDAGYQAYLEDPSQCATGNSWDCYFATLEPQNDPWQIYQFESARLATKKGTDVQLARDEIAWASGYHSLKECIERDGGPVGYGDDSVHGSTLATVINFFIPRAEAFTYKGLVGSSAIGASKLALETFPLQNQGGGPSSITPIGTSGGADGATTFPLQGDGGGPIEMTPIGTNGPVTQTGGANGTVGNTLSSNCTEYLIKTPGDSLAGQVNAYLDAPMKILEGVDEIEELGGAVISGIQSFMNGKGLTSVNEAGTQGINQGNGVTTFPLQP